MNHVLELKAENLQVRVEAGVIYKELNQYLSRYGLFFPPDYGGSSTRSWNFAKSLQLRGYNVGVISAFPQYP
jgi:FAD/FMN-containing dehydrogenase